MVPFEASTMLILHDRIAFYIYILMVQYMPSNFFILIRWFFSDPQTFDPQTSYPNNWLAEYFLERGRLPNKTFSHGFSRTYRHRQNKTL
jgi:hypothetical protein